MKKTLLVGLLCLSSCTISMSHREQTENLLPQPSLESSTCDALSTSFFQLDEWPDRNWWTVFQSQELNCLIEEALANNPTIWEVQTRIEQAKQESVIARSKLAPLIFFDADVNWLYLSKNGLYRALNPNIPLNAKLIDLSLSFTYDFDFWGKNKNLLLATLGQQMVERAEAINVELITAAAVAQAYFALKTNLQKQRLYQMLFDVREKTSQLQEKLQKYALSSQLLPLSYEESAMDAKKQLVNIQAEIEIDKHLLNTLVGRGADTCLEVDDCLPELPKTISIPCNLSCDLLARRPDLMSGIWRVKALSHNVGAAIADFYPDFNLSGFAGLESIFFSTLFQTQSKNWGIKPAVHLPIFTAGAIRANVREQKALFDEAVFAYNALLLKSVQEVADLLSYARSIYEQKEIQNHILEAAQSRFKLSILRREKGLDTLFNNYLIQQELIEKQLQNIAITYDQYVAAIKLIKALGGGFCAEVPLQAKLSYE